MASRTSFCMAKAQIKTITYAMGKIIECLERLHSNEFDAFLATRFIWISSYRHDQILHLSL